jgi:hypothetical protein
MNDKTKLKRISKCVFWWKIKLRKEEEVCVVGEG